MGAVTVALRAISGEDAVDSLARSALGVNASLREGQRLREGGGERVVGGEWGEGGQVIWWSGEEGMGSEGRQVGKGVGCVRGQRLREGGGERVVGMGSGVRVVR